ncbi:hypothetical protein ACEPAI_9273 [Sanghuangporus weigelae]
MVIPNRIHSAGHSTTSSPRTERTTGSIQSHLVIPFHLTSLSPLLSSFPSLTMSHRQNTRPSQDRDYSMPPPPSVAWQPSPSVNGGERPILTHQQLTDKYSNLKRRYFQLDDGLKETQVELQKSMERNTKLRSERNILLDRIIELEERNKLLERHLEQFDPAFVAAHKEAPATSTGAFPRALVTERARAAFVANLQQAMAEVESEDPSVDPVLLSRHVRPGVRKREAEEMERRQELEARELKRQKRTRPVPGAGPSPGSTPAPIIVTRNGNGNGLTATDAAQLQPVQFQWRASGSGTPSISVERNKPMPVHERPESPHESSRVASGLSNVPPSLPREQRESLTREDSMSRPDSESPISPAPYYQTETRFIHSDIRETSAPTVRSQERSPTEPVIIQAPLSPRLHSASRQPMAPPPVPSFSLPPPPPASTRQRITMNSAPRPSDLQRLTKPKRLKAHTVTSKSHSIPTVPRDRATGRPLLPLNVGIMTVLSLGEVCMREHFHTERYIFPIGYEVTRRYLSTQDPNAEVVYHCTILDGGDGPKFQIIAADMPDKPIIAGTATGAWSGIVRAANLIRKRQHSNSVSGPDYFGLGQNTIKHLIQELPGADRLKNYVWQNFVEGGPLGGRHAAVIPALPEEYETSMAVGAYHNRERERATHSVDAGPGLGLSVMPEPIPIRHIDDFVEGDRDPSRQERGRIYGQRHHNRRGRSASSSSTSTVSARRAPSAQRQGAYAASPPPSSATSTQTSMSVQSQSSLSPTHAHSDSRHTRSQSYVRSPNVPPKLASIMHAYAPPNAPLTSHSRASAPGARSSYSPESAVVQA